MCCREQSAFLTFTEHEVRGDVEGLDLDVVHGHGDALLVVAGDEGEGLLRQAHEGAPGGGDQGREAVRAGCVPPSWRDGKTERVTKENTV